MTLWQVGTFVADWMDNMCYSHMDPPAWQTGDLVDSHFDSGLRGCPFYFRSCFD